MGSSEPQDLSSIINKVNALNMSALDKSIKGSRDAVDSDVENTELIGLLNDFKDLKTDEINEQQGRIDELGNAALEEEGSVSEKGSCQCTSGVVVVEGNQVNGTLNIEIQTDPKASHISMDQLFKIFDQLEVLFHKADLPIKFNQDPTNGLLDIQLHVKSVESSDTVYYDPEKSSPKTHDEDDDHQVPSINQEGPKDKVSLLRELKDGIIFQSRYPDEPNYRIDHHTSGFSIKEISAIIDNNQYTGSLSELIKIRLIELNQYEWIKCNYII